MSKQPEQWTTLYFVAVRDGIAEIVRVEAETTAKTYRVPATLVTGYATRLDREKADNGVLPLTVDTNVVLSVSSVNEYEAMLRAMETTADAVDAFELEAANAKRQHRLATALFDQATRQP